MKNDKAEDKKNENKVKEKQDKHEEETSALKNQIEELEDKYKRALADYQNLEKRSREERTHWIQTANKELLLRLLPVLDTLILANQHGVDEGLKVSIQQFQDVLKNEGVEKIETTGKIFDPRLMECIVTASNAADAEEGKDIVTEELRAGYILNDIVLRPAQVKVGKEVS